MGSRRGSDYCYARFRDHGINVFAHLEDSRCWRIDSSKISVHYIVDFFIKSTSRKFCNRTCMIADGLNYYFATFCRPLSNPDVTPEATYAQSRDKISSNLSTHQLIVLVAEIVSEELCTLLTLSLAKVSGIQSRFLLLIANHLSISKCFPLCALLCLWPSRESLHL